MIDGDENFDRHISSVTDVYPYKTNKPGGGSGSKPTHKPGGGSDGDLVEELDLVQYQFALKF